MVSLLRVPAPACRFTHYRPQWQYGEYQANPATLNTLGETAGYIRHAVNLDPQGGYLERMAGESQLYTAAALRLGDCLKDANADWWLVVDAVGPVYTIRWTDSRDRFISGGPPPVVTTRVWGPVFGPVFG